MKRSELIDNLENEDYSVYNREGYLEVVHNNSNALGLMISEKELFYIASYGENSDVDEYVFEICCKYSATPLEEREEPKTYYLKTPVSHLYHQCNFVNYDVLLDECFVGSKKQNRSYKTQFTEKEINDLPYQEFIQTLIKEEVK